MVKIWGWASTVLLTIELAACQKSALVVIDPLKHDVIALNPKNYVDSFEQYRPRFPGAVLYYTDASSAAEYIKATWNPLARKLRGMARIAAVDCTSHKSLCSEVDLNSDSPALQIRIFPPLPQPSYKVDEHLAIAKLRTQVLKHLPAGNFKVINDEASLKAFVQDEANIPKVFIFNGGEKKPSSWWHAIIHNFTDRMSFAQITNRELAEKLKILKKGAKEQLPIIALKVKDITVSGKGVDIFQGKVKDFGAIQEWLNVRSETFARGGGIDHNIKHSSMAKPWLEEKYPELTRASHKDICFALKDELCAILAVPAGSAGLDPALARMLDDLRQNVKKPALRYSWVSLDKEQKLAEALNLTGAKDLPIFVVVNPHKRLRFTVLRSAKTNQDILQFIEKLKSGDVRFTPIRDGIPTFASRVSKTEEL